MASHSKLVEYLYIDEKRLTSYCDQISSPLAYDKVPKWGFELEIKGPAIKLERSAFARPLTKHEKITRLMKYLGSEHLLVSGVAAAQQLSWLSGGKHIRTDFFLEDLLAVKVFFPPREDAPPWFSGLTMWVSLHPVIRQGDQWTQARRLKRPLFLIEDWPQADGGSIRMSGYSMLRCLVSFSGPELVLTVNGDAFTQDHISDAFGRRLANDPIGTLVHLGAHAGERRVVHTLYRLRCHFGEEYSRTPFAESAFGYPIFVCEPPEMHDRLWK